MAETTSTRSPRQAGQSLTPEVEAAVAWLKRRGTARTRDGMARYGLPSDKAFGVPVGTIQQLAKRLGRNHQLAAGLWDTGWYEARLLAAFVDEPERVTPAQMDRWCRDFDNWGVCDTVCFHLFDRTPHAFGKVAQWSRRRDEFARRGRLRAAGLSRAARQAGGRCAVPALPAARRAGRRRRAQLRQEGRELGASPDRASQSRAQRGVGGACRAAGGFSAAGSAMGGEGRAEGADKPRGETTPRATDTTKGAADTTTKKSHGHDNEEEPRTRQRRRATDKI